jgi:hypothetical protein
MPPREKRMHREKTAIRRLFEEKRHIGGRLPNITEAPTEAKQPENQQEEVLSLPVALHHSPEPTGFDDLTPEDFQTRKKGKRAEKATGLQVILNAVQRDGFPHPRERQGFLMLPHEFKALLALESLAVVQIVYEIFERTIGWEDKAEPHGRREWARLSIRYFQISCGMTLSQVQRGLKGALNRGYIVRRSRLGSYEYSIRWRKSDQIAE